MQQLYLTGDGASASAAQLMNALNVPFSGFRLTPVHLGGACAAKRCTCCFRRQSRG